MSATIPQRVSGATGTSDCVSGNGLHPCAIGTWTRAQVLLVLAALLLLSTGVALTAAATARLSLGSPLREVRAPGPKISNSKKWKPLFTVSQFYPGDVTRSSVRIRNVSRVPGVLYLSMRNLRNSPVDQPRLSDRLWLRIWWKRTNGTARLVWQGPMSGFHRVRVCVLKPRQARVFRFSVLFRGRSVGGWSDSSVMGHATRFGLRWRIVPRR